MKSIEAILASEGDVRFVSTPHNTLTGIAYKPQKMRMQLSNVYADPSSCTITVHFRTTANQRVIKEADTQLFLQDVRRAEVATLNDQINEYHRQTGHPELTETHDPTVYSTVMFRSSGPYGFTLDSKETAKQLLGLISSAVKLCGGKLEY